MARAAGCTYPGDPMAWSFEELDYRHTELGELILRRRRPIGLAGIEVYEVKLDGRFLMSSLVTDSERELARRALERVDGAQLRVLVGGLGLGHTAAEVLRDPRVIHLDVVERLPEVIAWHERRLVPLGATLVGDSRCHLVHDDCFARIRAPGARSYDVILIDIDDSPIHLLDEAHAGFYTVPGLRQAAGGLRPGGIFGLWTAMPAEPEITARLQEAFGRATVHEVRLHNPLLDAAEVNAIYYAQS
jgi:spermidine synthase